MICTDATSRLKHFIEKRKVYLARTAKPLYWLWLCPVIITSQQIELESCSNSLKKQNIS